VEWASAKEMQQVANETLAKALRLCHASCCSELQVEERDKLLELLKKIARHRDQAIGTRNEEEANAAFLHCSIVSSVINYLQLWLLIKDDRMEEAWDQLVDAQDALRCALRFVKSDTLQHVLMELLALERLLFPPQQFVSGSDYWDYADCTICEGVYGECDHVAGRLYMGSMCAKRPHEIVGVNHVALVDNPRDKGCRWTKIKRDGFMYCTLTLRQLEKAGDDKGNVELIVLRPRKVRRVGGTRKSVRLRPASTRSPKGACPAAWPRG
jgi:hypothetical protein